jgi:tellurite resistance protein
MAVARTAKDERSLPRPGFGRPRVPPHLFAMTFGLAGLAGVWRAATPWLGAGPAVADAIDILDGALWLVLVGAYLAQGPRAVLGDLRHPVLSPFVSLPGIVAMLLVTALAPDALAAARTLLIVFLALTILLGGWLTGQWMTGGIDRESVHPAYFLPTVAGGLIGAYGAAQLHLHALAEASFGIGVICWVMLGATVLNRLFFAAALPAALVPTMAIEVAPPAVAGLAYFALTGLSVSFVACALGGYAILMVLVQIRLIPVYRRLAFSPGFWSFTFSYAATAALALVWLTVAKPPGAAGYAIVVVVLITAFTLSIAARTVALAVRGRLFPVS